MLVIALAAFALAQAPEPADETIHAAVFAPLAKAEQRFARLGPAGAFYPDAAVRKRRNGKAVLRCVAGPAGRLDRCEVVSESPPRLHFGAAARVLAERGRITVADAPAGAVVFVGVPFTIGAPAEVQP